MLTRRSFFRAFAGLALVPVLGPVKPVESYMSPAWFAEASYLGQATFFELKGVKVNRDGTFSSDPNGKTRRDHMGH